MMRVRFASPEFRYLAPVVTPVQTRNLALMLTMEFGGMLGSFTTIEVTLTGPAQVTASEPPANVPDTFTVKLENEVACAQAAGTASKRPTPSRRMRRESRRVFMVRSECAERV